MKILLHICCGNCAIFPLDVLRSHQHQVHGLFFNPNIHPYQEFQRRREAAEQFARLSDLPVVWHDQYLLEDFLAAVSAAPEQRCTYCYASRLEHTARTAAAEGFDAFTSSLLYSRYQRHEDIRELGEKLAQRYGVAFFYKDFRRGWQQGITASKAMGLYRQQYCGCIYSEKDRYHPRPQK
jgi:epoxyqueuosine reductase